MAEPTPIFGGSQAPEHVEDPLQVPEALVINAFLEAGEWDPKGHGLDGAMVLAWHQAWNFCQDHFDQTGKAPSVGLFARSFPTFEVISGVDPTWAADRLKVMHHERSMRRGMQEAIQMLNAKDYEGAQAALLEVHRPQLTVPKGMNVLDPASVAHEVIKAGWQVPWSALMHYTQGVGRGELWYLAARLGQGKSWMAPYFAVVAAEHGARVKVLTVEMPEAAYIRRIHAFMARMDPDVRRALRDENEVERRAALKALPELAGAIEVFDPSRMKMNIKAIEQACANTDVLVIDHVGLLSDATGKRAIEDWRVMAVISNTLKELTLSHKVSIVAAAQVNREGENGGGGAPKVSQLSQSDALGQDADVVMTYRRMGERAMLHNIAKNRNGRAGRFYTAFEPDTVSFDEISPDQARAIAMADEALAAGR